MEFITSILGEEWANMIHSTEENKLVLELEKEKQERADLEEDFARRMSDVINGMLKEVVAVENNFKCIKPLYLFESY